MEKRITIATVADATLIAALADEIWKEHYFPMSGEAYVLHLLKTLQSEEIIEADIASERAVYYLLYIDSEAAPDGDTNRRGRASERPETPKMTGTTSSTATTQDGQERIPCGLLPVGYCAVNVEEKAVCLSKLYVKKAYRQNGLSRMMIDYLKEHFAHKEYIHLIVNKKNAGSIAAYRHLGFTITGDVIIDAGAGHFMNDYVMKLTLH